MRWFRFFAHKSVGVAAVAAMAFTTLVAPAASAATPLVPSAPWDPKITSISNTSVTLTWQDPLVNAASVASFSVQQTTNDLTWSIAATGIPTSITGVYTQILPVSIGTTYRFRVIAHTVGLGDSPASVAVDASTQYTQITAGLAHTCALTAAGTVFCWGSNNQGQLGNGTLVDAATPVAVPSLSGVTAIAAGANHTCALLSDGSMKCWGDNIVGQLGDATTTDRLTPTTVSGITTANSIAAGYQHTCATLVGGTARCWGLNTNGQLGNGTLVNSSSAVVVTGISNATQITAGFAHSCARLSTGDVSCWGQGGLGQLGNGIGTNSSTPVLAGLSSSTAASVKAGDYHTCAVMTAGTVECWGSNGAGQLGDGTTTSNPLPTPVTGITNAASVALGANHTCLRLTSNEIACFGQNSSGQLGDGTFTNRLTAVVLAGLDPTSSIAAGSSHTCITSVTGPAFCWGSGASGQLGQGGKSNLFTPTAVESSTAIAVAEGNAHSCALTSDGIVKCWGQNTSGQLGDGTTIPTSRTNPTSALGIQTAVAVATGGTHTCAVQADGSVWCWGSNVSGQLGDGTTLTRTTPVQVAGITGAVSVSAGVSHTCALLATGSVSCWGANTQGQLGNGTVTDSLAPVTATGITNAVQIYAGYQSTCAVMSDTTVYCWGLNNVGQLGDGTTTNRNIPTVIPALSATYVQVGLNNGCAVLTTGAVRCWGANGNGQIGDGTTTARLTPTQVSGITSGATQVTVGNTFACAVFGLVGNIQCWGSNINGELGNSTNSQSTVPVSVTGIANAINLDAGINHVCATLSLGSVKCWGLNNQSQLGDLTTVSKNAPVFVNNIDSVLIAPSTTPDVPTGVTAQRGDGSVLVSWTASASNGSALLGYTVTSSPASAGCTASAVATSCTVSGLTNGTAYTFTVVATNGRGSSAPSTATAPVTPAAIPTAPTAVTAVRGDQKATVSWTASNGNGQPITSYTATAYLAGVATAQFCVTGGTLTCDVTGLTNGTAYTFVVKATNIVGDSFNSAPSAAVTPAGVPLAVSGIVMTRTATGATVTWSAANGNGDAVTGYSVAINGGIPCTTNAATRTCTFIGLNATAAYTVAVSATNTVGTNVARIVAAPSLVVATRGDTQATVAWAAAAGGDLLITSYTVTAYNATTLAASGTCTYIVGVSLGSNTCDVTGLTNGTSYFFRVVATDSAGNTAAAADSAAVTPAGRPTTPGTPTAVRGDSSATITWAASSPNGSVVTGYTVTSNPSSLVCTTTTALTCTITGLTNGTSYTFSVVATNAVGNSTASADSNAVVPAKAPDIPTAVTAVRGDGSASVSWTAPAANGETITNYRVTSSPGGFVCNSASSPCTVTGLTNGTSYTFTVTATNAVGTSGPSAASNAVTPAGVPTAPTTVTAVRGDTQATVSWIASNANGTAITGYTVTANPGGAVCSTTPISVNPLSCTVTGLTNGQAYTFTVVATNAIGSSSASSPSAAVTPAKAPDAPTGASAVRGDTKATVSWSAAVNNGDPVTSYTVTSSPGSFTCTTSGLTCDVTGLSNGVSYTFTVTATNGVGTSAASVATSAVIPAGVPLLTTPVTVTRGDTQATISWPAATPNGTVVTGYTVTSVPASAGCTTTVSLTCVITGLTNGTSYTFSVTATNAVGTSAAVSSNSTVIGVVPIAPATVSAVRGDQKATVSWSAADGKGTTVSGYTVTATPGGAQCTVGTGVTTCDVTGLTNGTPYTFTVVATNIIGNSLASGASSPVTPAGVPQLSGTVSVVRGDTQATVSWLAGSANGDAITGYTVTASGAGGQFCNANGVTLSCVVTGLTNGTAYTFSVVAANTVGNSAPISSASTIIGVAPYAPTGVTATRADRAANVSWTAADGRGLTVSGYTVTSSPGGLSCTTATTSCQVTGLTNGTIYTFTVTATNSIGTSVASTASGTVTPAGVPLLNGVPTVTRGDTTATISWSAASDNGDAVTGYRVAASGVGGQFCAVNAVTLTCTITGLTNGVPYTFALTATNTVGTSTSASSASIVLGLAPLPPTSVTALRGDSSATVSWSLGDGRGFPITGYTATATPSGFSCSTTPLDVTPTSCVIPGLSNGTSYTFTVTSTNVVTTSAASPPSAAVIPAGAPLAPTGVVTVRGNTQVTVSWNAATPNGEPVLQYFVTATAVGSLVPGPTCSTTVGFDLNPLTCTVLGLANGTQYTFSVVGRNVVGNGAAGVSGITTPATLPSAPISISATRADASANVSWAAAVDNGDPVISYTVTSNPGSFTCVVTTTSCVVPGLTNGTSYTFTVTATNGIGTSAVSIVSNAVVPAGAPNAPTLPVATRGDRQATVSWAASTIANGAPITGYTVTATPGGATCVTVIGVDLNPLTCTVLGLTNAISYTFTVTAQNLTGSSVPSLPSTAVIPAGVPVAPTAVTAVRGDSSVQVSWTSSPLFTGDGNGAAITTYTATASTGQTCTAAAPATTCVVLGLTNGTSYTFTVTATNVIGTSLSSVPSLPAVPAAGPVAPTTVSATRGDRSATVTWSGANANGSPITGYEVTSNPEALTCTTVGNSCVVLGLTNGTAYTFTVVAINVISRSLPSNPSTAVTPAGVPIAPTNLIVSRGNQSISVSWSSIGTDNGAPITAYEVVSNPGGFVCTNTLTTCTFNGLTNGTQYSFAVRSQNVAGWSALSAWSTPTAPAAAPLAPTGVSAIQGANSATVSWNAADDNGLPVTSYRVTASPGGSTCNTNGALTCTVLNLMNGQQYTFTVTASNVLGMSPASAASGPVVPMTIPDAPTNVVGTLGNASASITWNAANNQGSPVFNYIVTASPGGASCTSATTSCVVLGLTNGTAYTFTVKAVNSVGTSAASIASAEVIPATLPGVPQNVTAVRGNQSATVSWTASASNGSAIIEYRVIPSAGTSSCITNTTTCVVTGLVNGASYTFTVKATNGIGTSLASAPTTTVIPAGPADAPTNVTAVAGASIATVSWTAALANNGAPVTGYRVVSNPGAKTCLTASPDVLSCSVSGLTNGVAYTFSVYALSDVGDSVASVASVAVTPTGAPGAVTKMIASSSAVRTATITWSGGTLNGAALVSYEYSYKLSSSSAWRPWVPTGKLPKAVVKSLAKGKTYQFKFRLTTTAGRVVSKPFNFVPTK